MDKLITYLYKEVIRMECKLTSAFCPECGGDINYRKRDKEFCNCKKCSWYCKETCGAQHDDE